MSSTLTKNLVLSQHKVVMTPGEEPTPTLTHESVIGEGETVLKVEIAGVDPSTVSVSCEGNTIRVECPKGVLTYAVDLSTDTSKIRADIQWGILSLTIPHPPAPTTHAIKVSVHDAVKSSASKAPAKFTDED